MLAPYGRPWGALLGRPLTDGTEVTFLAGEEKGIDVRVALDVIRMAHRNELDHVEANGFLGNQEAV